MHLPGDSYTLDVGVEVTFLAERPEAKIRVTVKADGAKREVVISKGQPVQWAGMLYVPSTHRAGT